MIKALGTKKTIFIIVVLLVDGFIGGAYYSWLQPLRESVSTELQSTKSSVDEKYSEVSRMKGEFVLLQSQLRSFKELEAHGFFNNQDRSVAIDSLSTLSNYAGILAAQLKFSRGQLIADPLADQAGQVVINSPVVISIKSIDDVDVYTFLKLINEKFLGIVDITSIDMNKAETFDVTALRSIGSGKLLPLMGAEIKFNWITMASKDVIAPAEVKN
jgi:hypothetical protein